MVFITLIVESLYDFLPYLRQLQKIFSVE